MNIKEILSLPLKYHLPWSKYGRSSDRQFCTLEAVIGRDSMLKWCIREGGECLRRDGEWEYEPQPSSRTDEFIAATRWPSAEEAGMFAANHFEGTKP